MDKYPLVSIITATYKKFTQIFSTIDSVMNQDYPNIEYIITDDGSDNFPSIEIKEYLREKEMGNIQHSIIHHPFNIGTVKNLNNAYKISNGDIIINLSCGDVFFSKDVVRKICERFCETSCDVLVTSRIVYEGNFEAKYLLPHYKEREIIKKYDSGIKQYKAFIASGFYDMASGSAMSFSRSIMEKMGYYDERYMLWEDGPFLAKFLQVGKLEFAYDIVSIWYENGGVSSSNIANTHPKMKADIDLFTNHEKVSHLEMLNHFEKRRLIYRNKRIHSKGIIQRLILYFYYFPEMVFFIHYTQSRKRYEKMDYSVVKELLQQNMNNIEASL